MVVLRSNKWFSSLCIFQTRCAAADRSQTPARLDHYINAWRLSIVRAMSFARTGTDCRVITRLAFLRPRGVRLDNKLAASSNLADSGRD